MSALRPVIRHNGLLRHLRRNYATPANPSANSSTVEKAQQTGQQVAQKTQEVGRQAVSKTQETGQQVATKAQEAGQSVVSKAQETGQKAAAKAQEIGAQAKTQAQATGSQVVSKAQETSTQAIAKASDALKKGMDAAGPMATKLGQGTANVVSKIPGGGDKLVGRVQSLIPPAIYYSKVGLELSKQVFHGQKMSPPSLATFQEFYAPVYRGLWPPSQIWSNIKSLPSKIPATPSPSTMLENLRGTSRKEWAGYGVLVAEFVGFFTVGEMIGRRKIVGYRGPSPAAHH